MLTTFFRTFVKFATVALVAGVTVVSTGCGAVNASSGIHTTADSRVAHFDRESSEHRVF